MRKFKKGESVELLGGGGKWFPAIIVSQNDYREPSMEYAVDVVGFDLPDVIFCGEDRLRKKD